MARAAGSTYTVRLRPETPPPCTAHTTCVSATTTTSGKAPSRTFRLMAPQAARDTFLQAVGDAVTAATAPGHQPEPQIVAGFSDMGTDEVKRLMPGSVLQLSDDRLLRVRTYVPLTHAVVVLSSGEVKVAVRASEDASATQRSMQWMADNVTRVAAGVLSRDGRAGANAAGLNQVSSPRCRPRCGLRPASRLSSSRSLRKEGPQRPRQSRKRSPPQGLLPLL